MTTDPPPAPARHASWQSPIDLSRYDCTPHLTPEECRAIDQLVADFDRHYGGPRTRATMGIIDRLLLPIRDVLALRPSLSAHTIQATTILLIRAMQRQHAPFWAWTTDVWIDLLTIPQTPRQRQRQASSRQNLAIIAYLLCHVRDVHAAGGWDYVPLARSIFGAPAIDATISTMLQELARWGYGAQLSKQTVPKVLCQVLLVNGSPQLTDLTAAAFQTVYQQGLARPSQLGVLRMSRVLASLGILPEQIGTYTTGTSHTPRFDQDATVDVPPAWLAWCQRWYATSTRSRRSRKSDYSKLLRVGAGSRRSIRP
jgi:hypothetical protein